MRGGRIGLLAVLVLGYGSVSQGVDRYVVKDNPGAEHPFASWEQAAPDIQSAIDAALPGETVWVSNGVYRTGGLAGFPSTTLLTNRVAIYKPITVRSVNGPAVTAIEGQGPPGTNAVRCAYLGVGAALAGFTLTNGATWVRPTVPADGQGAGALCIGAGTISNCVLTGNVAWERAGGVHGGTLVQCKLVGNRALTGGGAMYSILRNSLLVGNYAASSGGGAYGSRLVNCTVVGNTAGSMGAGLHFSSATNCIVSRNFGAPSSHVYGSTLGYSCTYPLAVAGVGNTNADPRFVDAATGNYRLRADSPCIDTGANAAVAGDWDLDGRARIVGGRVDMGAYELDRVSDTDGDGMPDWWEFEHSSSWTGMEPDEDLDGDGMNNLGEYIAGTHPKDPGSVFRIVQASWSPVEGGFSLTWSSVTSRQYTVYSAADPSAPWGALSGVLSAQPPLNTYVDTLSPSELKVYAVVVGGTVASVNPAVGYLKVEVPAEATVLTACPFDAFDPSLMGVLGAQLTGSSKSLSADQVGIWGQADREWRWHGRRSTSPQWYAMTNFWGDPVNPPVEHRPLSIRSVHTYTQAVWLAGDVPYGETNFTCAIEPGTNFLAYRYPAAIAITNLALTRNAVRGAEPSLSDQLRRWDSAAGRWIVYWLPPTGGWVKDTSPPSPAPVATADILRPGESFLYWRIGDPMTWNEPMPYQWNDDWGILPPAMRRLVVDGAPARHGVSAPFGYGTNTIASGTTITNRVNSPADEANGTHYICRGWSGTGSVPPTGWTNTVEFTITNASSLIWQWQTEHWLSIEVTGQGVVDVGDGWHTNGAEVVLTATPAPGWQFTRWQIGPRGYSEENPLRVTLTAPLSLTAVFDGIPQPTHAILATAGAHGQIAPSGTVMVVEGSNQTFRIVADPNYHVTDVRADDLSVGAVTNYTFPNVVTSHTIHADFDGDPRTLRVVSAYGEADPPVGTVTSRYGSQLVCRLLTPSLSFGSTQYMGTGWSVSGGLPSSGMGPMASFTLQDHAVLTWQWATNYWVQTATNGCGTVTPASGWKRAGSPESFAAQPGPGYTFMGWSGTLPPGVAGQPQFQMPIEQPVSVTAHFADITPPAALVQIRPGHTRGQNVRIDIAPSETLAATPAVTVVDAAGAAVAITSLGQEDGAYGFLCEPEAASEGVATVSIDIRDPTGNWNKLTRTFRVDRTVPVLQLSAPSPAGLGHRPLSVFAHEALGAVPMVRVNDAGDAPLAVSFSHGSGNTYYFTFEVTAAHTEGTAAIAVSGVDLAGNTGVVSGAVFLDTHAPEATLEVAPLLGRGTHSVVVTPAEPLPAAPVVTARDFLSRPLVVGSPRQDGARYLFPLQVTGPSADGLATVRATVADAAGNATVLETNTVIDVTAPVLTITVQPDPPDGSMDVSVTVTASEPLRAPPAATFSLDGYTALPGTGPEQAGLTYTWLLHTGHMAVAAAQGVDWAGNTGRVVRTFADVAVFNSGIAFSAVPGLGSDVTVFALVTNAGPCRVENVLVRMGSPMGFGQAILADHRVALDAGQTTTVSAFWSASMQSSGNVIRVEVDPDGVLPETCETNNWAMRGPVAIHAPMTQNAFVLGDAPAPLKAQVYDSITLRTLDPSEAAVSAWLEDADGARVSGPWTVAYAEPGPWYETELDPADPGLQPGAHEVVWEATGAQFAPATARLPIRLIRDFSVTLEADAARFQRGSPVTLSGDVLDVTGNPLVGRAVTLLLSARFGSRQFSTATDTNGHFRLVYQPAAAEAGEYTVTATVTEAGIARQSPACLFAILGLYVTGPSGTIQVPAGAPQTLSYKIHNLGTVPLTGLEVVLEDKGGAADVIGSLDLGAVGDTLGGDQTVMFALNLSAAQVPGTRVFRLRVRTAEESEAQLGLAVEVLAFQPKVEFIPSSLETVVALNDLVTRSVRIRNSGWSDVAGAVLGADRPDWVAMGGAGPIIGSIPGQKGLSDEGFGLLGRYGLIARIGEGGEPFQIGAAARRTAGTGGELFFRINESDALLADNQGALTVRTRLAGQALAWSRTVQANQGWQAAGLSVAAGQEFDVSAEGAWQTAAGETRDAAGNGCANFSITWAPKDPALALTGKPVDWTIRLTGSNITEVVLPLRSWVVASGTGHARFRVANLADAPLESARITLYARNYDPVLRSFPTYHGVTGADGCVQFSDLAPGPYGYRAEADEYEDAYGNLDVIQGQTTERFVTLKPAVVSIFWDVVETTIQDHYEIVLKTTYLAVYPPPPLPIVYGDTNAPPPSQEKVTPPILVSGGIHHVMERNGIRDGKLNVRNVGGLPAEYVRLTLPTLTAPATLLFAHTTAGSTSLWSRTCQVPVLLPGEEREIAYRVDLREYGIQGADMKGQIAVTYDYRVGLPAGGTATNQGGTVFDVRIETLSILDSAERLVLDPPVRFVFREHSIGFGLPSITGTDLGEIDVYNPSHNQGVVTDFQGPFGFLMVKSLSITELLGLAVPPPWKLSVPVQPVLGWFSPGGAGQTLAPGESCTASLMGLSLSGFLKDDLLTVGAGAVVIGASWDRPPAYWTLDLVPIFFCSVATSVDFCSLEWKLPVLPDDDDWLYPPGGFITGIEIIWPPIDPDPQIPKPPPAGYITFEITQDVTFDRQAFVAKLRVVNGSAKHDLDNLRVDIRVADGEGNVLVADHRLVSELFFAEPTLKGIGSVDGLHPLAMQSDMNAEWLIVPTFEAGDKTFHLTACLSWVWDGQPCALESKPAEIYVKPQPFVHLDYFIQPEFEADKPFYLGVRASNIGAGPVHNLAIKSHQPVIVWSTNVANPEVEIIGAEGLRAAVSSDLSLHFDTLETNQCGLGRWLLKANPGGKVVEFVVQDVKHDEALGGEATSLLSASAHICWVERFGLRNDTGGGTGTPAVLLDRDTNGVPDTLFDEADGRYHDVTAVEPVVIVPATLGDRVMAVTVTKADGWIYGELDHPFGGSYPLAEIRTQAGRVLSTNNVWVAHGRICFVDDPDEQYILTFGDQPHVPTHTGVLTLNKDGYRRFAETAQIRLTDPDLDRHEGSGNDSAEVRASSGQDAYGERILLVETQAGVFEGTLGFDANASPSNGLLKVGDGQLFTVTYADAADEGGAPAAVTTQAPWIWNGAPAIVEPSPVQVVMDEDSSPQAFNLVLHATDPDGDALEWTIAVPASNGIPAVEASGTLHYAPAADWNGSDGFTVRVTDGMGGTGSVAVAVTVRPRNDPPVHTAVPEVIGAHDVGKILTAGPGLWNDAADTQRGGVSVLTFAFQWRRAEDAAGAGAVDIPGATGSSYLLKKADRHQYVQVRVTCSDTGVGEPASTTAQAMSPWTFVNIPLHDLRVIAPHGIAQPAAGLHTLEYETGVECRVSGVDTQGTTQYVCVGWVGTGSVPAEGGTTNVVVTLTNDSAIVWQWATNYWLETQAEAHGSVTPVPGWHAAGATVLVSAVAKPHWHFAGWSGTGTNRITQGDVASPTVTVTVVESAVLAAHFAIDRHTLAVESVHGVPEPGVGVHTNDWGTNLECRVSGVEGAGTTQYVCVGWALTGQSDTNGQTGGSATNVVMVHTNDAVLAWNWKTQFWLSVNAEAHGAVDVASRWVDAGGRVTVAATADAHYHFAGWAGDTNGCDVADNVITAAMSQARSITAVFAIDRHTLAVESAHGGAMPPAGANPYDYGTAVSCLATNSPVYDGVRATQYVCVGWVGTGSVPAEGGTTNVVVTLTNDSAIVWQWATNYWLETQAEAHGSVTPVPGWHAAGATVLVSAVAEPHWHFAGWSGTGTNRITQGDVAAPAVSLTLQDAVELMAGFAENLALYGTPHWWLALHKLTNDFDRAAETDQDKDGMPAWAEFRADTIPTNAESVLAIVDIEPGADGIRIRMKGGVCAWQFLECHPGLADRGAPWQPLFTNHPPTSVVTNYVHCGVTNGALFYRIRAQRP